MAAAVLGLIAIWGGYTVAQTSVTAAAWIVVIVGGIGCLIIRSVFSKLLVGEGGFWLGSKRTGWEQIGGKLYGGSAQLEGETEALAGGSFMVGGQLHDFLSFEGGPYIKALFIMRATRRKEDDDKRDVEPQPAARRRWPPGPRFGPDDDGEV